MDNITVSFVHVVDKSLTATAVMLLYCLYMGSIQFVISLELTMNLYFLDFYACFSCFYRNEIDKGRKWNEKEKKNEIKNKQKIVTKRNEIK